jgi:hypothetical protein
VGYSKWAWKDDLNSGTISLRKPLNDMINSLNDDEGTGWRNTLFCTPPDGGRFGAGVLNMSPAWFQRTHEVS